MCDPQMIGWFWRVYTSMVCTNLSFEPYHSTQVKMYCKRGNSKFQLVSILGRFHCSCMILCCCVTVCVSQTNSLKPTHPHTQDVKVLSRLDSPLLPPLPVRSLSAGDQDDSLRTPTCTSAHLLYMYVYVPTYTRFRRVCMCRVSLADQIHMYK